MLNLKTEEGRRDAFRLARNADVVVENFRPGVMARLGLGWDALSEANPALVYCSISGFGQEGASASRPAYAPIIHAASGLDLALMEFQPGAERPAPTAMFHADVLAGVYAWGAIQTALLARSQTGRGQHIDVALMDSLLSMMVYECQEAQFPQNRKRHVYTPVKTLDGFVMVVPLSDKNFAAMLSVIGDPAWGGNPIFATHALREANWAELMAHVEGWTVTRTAETCELLFNDAGVPCSRYRTVAEALEDPISKARGVLGTVQDAAGSFGAPNPPFRMSQSPAVVGRKIPALGEANPEMLHWPKGTR